MNLPTYAARYVGDALSDRGRRADMVKHLEKGKPYTEEEFMIVAMIDISGYTSLTSYLVETLGKMSTEAITEVVGKYLGKIASIVIESKGDIVKFLGDAILVTFSSDPPGTPEPAASICLRALRCCAAVLRHCGTHEIDTDEWLALVQARRLPAPQHQPQSLPSSHRPSAAPPTPSSIFQAFRRGSSSAAPPPSFRVPAPAPDDDPTDTEDPTLSLLSSGSHHTRRTRPGAPLGIMKESASRESCRVGASARSLSVAEDTGATTAGSRSLSVTSTSGKDVVPAPAPRASVATTQTAATVTTVATATKTGEANTGGREMTRRRSTMTSARLRRSSGGGGGSGVEAPLQENPVRQNSLSRKFSVGGDSLTRRASKSVSPTSGGEGGAAAFPRRASNFGVATGEAGGMGRRASKMGRWMKAGAAGEGEPGGVNGGGGGGPGARKGASKRTLNLHLGITAGTVTRVVVGLPAVRLDYFIVGESLKDLGVLLDKASAGYIGISERIMKRFEYALDDVHEGDQLVVNIDGLEELLDKISLMMPGLAARPAAALRHSPTALPLIVAPTSDTPRLDDADPLLSAFINPALLFRLQANAKVFRKSFSSQTSSSATPEPVVADQTVFATEYRLVSVLFIKMGKGEEGAEGAKEASMPEKTQKMLAMLLEILRRQQGVFQQCSVDDKGHTLLGVFGLPPYRHDKCSIPAVRTALEFQRQAAAAFRSEHPNASLAAFDAWCPSMSVATGDILFGTVGCQGRKEGSFLGDVFNVAARLLDVQRPKGCLALDQASALEVRSEFSPFSLGFFKLKGKAEELEIFGLNPDDDLDPFTPRDRIGSMTPSALGDGIAFYASERQQLVGNRGEWEQLITGVDDFFAKRKPRFTALVQGMAGMGKSSLLGMLKGWVADKGKEICVARGTEVEQFRPYSVLQKIIQQLFPTDRVRKRSTIALSIPYAPSMDTNLYTSETFTFHAAASVEPMKSLLPVPGYGTLTRGRNTQRSRSFLSTHSNSPITKSLRLLLKECGEDPSLAPVVEEVIFSKAGAAESLGQPAQSGEGKKSMAVAAVIKVLSFSFSKPDRVLLLDDAQENAGLNMNSDEVIDVIHERTLGNMLQVDSILRCLQNMEEGDITPDMVSAILDKTVESLLMTQFDRLSPLYQLILRTASVLGHYFSFDSVFFLLGDSPHSTDVLQEALLSQNKLEFLQIDTDLDSDEPTVCFRHTTIRNAIYESIAVKERQRLHMKMAQRLELQMAMEVEERLSLFPLLCYHYSFSGDVLKTINNHIDYGCELSKALHYMECVQMLQKAVQLLESLDNMELVTVDRRRRALATLAYHSLWKAPNETVYRYAKTALELSGIKWPSSPKEAGLLTRRRLPSLLYRWILTKGATRDYPRKVSAEWFETVLFALRCIQNLMGAGIISVEEFVYALITGIWHAILCCRSDASQWFQTTLYAVMSLSASSATAPLSKFFARLAKKAKPYTGVAVHENCNMYQMAMGGALDLPKEGLDTVSEAVLYWRKCKNDNERARSIFALFFCSVLVGNLRVIRSLGDLELCKNYAVKDPVLSMLLLFGLQIECFYTESSDEWRKVTDVIPPSADAIPAQTKVIMAYIKPFVLFCGDVLFKASKLTRAHMVVHIQDMIGELHSTGLTSIPVNAFHYCLGILIAMDILIHRYDGSPAADMELRLLSDKTLILEQETAKLPKVFTCSLVSQGLAMAAHGLALGLSKQEKASSLWKRKAYAVFNEILKRKALRGRLEEGGDFFFVGALCHAVCGKVGDPRDGNENRMRLCRAGSMFDAMGAKFLSRWVRSEWV
ncbi:Adenylate cyclase type 10 [Phlyctochytrium bullatum]|nr:Adenylate cyclase type 10 [Phlyctochytrium bullatum]